MDTVSLYEQIDELEKKALAEDLDRHYPIYTSATNGKSLLTLLEETVLKQAPADYRLSQIFRTKHKNLKYGPENPFLVKIYQGMEIKVQKRTPLESTVEFAVLLPSNLEGVESYNKEAEAHNENWLKHGSLTSIFDPRHLEEIPVEGPVGSISYPSKHAKTLDLSSIYQGQLRNRPMPVMARAQVATITAKIEVVEEEFKVEYCVKNNKGELLYYSTLLEKDLSLIGRKLAQECFGNPFQISQTYIENLLEGIPFLLQGKKIKISSEDNKRPSWVDGHFKRRIDYEAAADTVQAHIYETTGRTFTYLGAFVSVLLATPFLWSGFTHGVSMEPSWDLEIGLLIALGGTAVCWIIGKFMYRQSEIKNQNKYLRF